MSDQIADAIEHAKRECNSTSGLAEDYLPDDLKMALLLSAQDQTASAAVGGTVQIWDDLTEIISNDGHARYLNATVLLSRNLVTLNSSRNAALNSRYPRSTVQLLKLELFKISSGSSSLFDKKIVRSILQFLANAAAGIDPIYRKSLIPVIEELFDLTEITKNTLADHITSDCILEFAALCNAIGTDYSQTLMKVVFDSSSFLPLLSRYLFRLEEQDSETHLFSYLGTFFQAAFDTGFIIRLLNGVQPLESKCNAIKLMDMMLPKVLPLCTDGPKLQEFSTFLIEKLDQTLTEAEKYFPQTKNPPAAGFDSEWRMIVSVLNLAEGTINNGSTTIKELLLEKKIVEKMVATLHVAEKHLPKKSKLKNLSELDDSGNPIEEYDPNQFPLVKVPLIQGLATLAEGRKTVQDKIRELHGLEVVLSNCIIDLNNPFIKEASIVCIKYLLENNQANQDFVAKLEAKQPVSEDSLKQAGYETEIENGKIRLKRA